MASQDFVPNEPRADALRQSDAEPSAAELAALQRDAGLSLPPTAMTYQLRMGVSGEGPRAHDWSDKPHRLVYDACSEAERMQDALNYIADSDDWYGQMRFAEDSDADFLLRVISAGRARARAALTRTGSAASPMASEDAKTGAKHRDEQQ